MHTSYLRRLHGVKAMSNSPTFPVTAASTVVVVLLTISGLLVDAQSASAAAEGQRGRQEPVILQVDMIVRTKLSNRQNLQLQRAQERYETARQGKDSKAIERCEKALARLEERFDRNRGFVALGRMMKERGIQPGGVGPINRYMAQEPCAVLMRPSDKDVLALQPGDFIELIRYDQGEAGRGPREELQQQVDIRILNPFTNAYKLVRWRKTARPDNWPLRGCETPWLLPDPKLTKEAQLSVSVHPKKWVYTSQNRVRYMLTITNKGDKAIRFANIWFQFFDANGKLIFTQKYYTNGQGDTIVEPSIKNLEPGDYTVIETFATKSVDQQMAKIDVVVLRLERP